MAIISSLIAAIGGFLFVHVAALSYLGAIAIAKVLVYGGMLLIFGGVALAMGHKEETGAASSPTYASSTLQSQTNNALPIPILYGKNKLAGNRMWQDDNVTTNITRIVGFAEGEINAFTDIRLNDIKSSDISGIQIEKYYGTATQNVCSFVTGSTNAERAELVGGLRFHAYLGIKVPKSDKIDGSYNLTSIVEGRKVRIYTSEDTYTVAYSNNPAWCLLDFLTCYNGGRIGVLNSGERDDNKIKSAIDIDSFIEAAAYCDEIVKTYQYTTALSGDNNDLVWVGRHANKALTLTYTAGATAGIAVSGNDITVTFINGTTKASDVIALVQSNPDINKLVNVYNADNNTGVGLISALAKTSFTEDSSSKRFTFNMIFDSMWLVSDVIEEFKKNCRGVLVKKGYKIQFKLDKPMAVSKVFNRDSIIQGSESVKTLERKERYDILDIKYIEPNIASEDSGEWAKCVARATLENYFNEPAVSHSVEIYSVIDFKQAARLSWFYLNRNVRCYFAGSFATDHRARDLEVGDVIQLSDFVMNFTDFKVKVLSVSEAQEGVFTIVWSQYDPEIYNDELSSLDPVIVYTKLNDPYAYPSDVTNFNVVQNKTLIQFSWTPVVGSGLSYEIRQGTSWANSTLIANNITDSTYITTALTTGIFTYWIKAKTKYQASENATSDVLNIDYIPQLNEVIVIEPITDNNGYFGLVFWTDSDTVNWQDKGVNYYTDEDGTWLDSGTATAQIVDGKLCLTSNQKWQVLAADWQNEGYAYYRDYNTGKWGTPVESVGYYTSLVYDVGAVLTSILSLNATFEQLSPDSTYTIYYRFSNDEIIWTNWIVASSGQFTFRYIQVRIVLNSPTNQQCYLSDLSINIDVPDREETYTDRTVTDSTNGITITYSTDIESKQAKDFIKSKPHVVATPSATNCYAVVTNSTAQYCTIKLYTNSGTLTTGNVNITVKGY